MSTSSASDEPIFSHALALPLGRRAAFLDLACGADRFQRERIEDLLRMTDEAPDFMVTSAVEFRRLADAREGPIDFAW